MEFNMEWNVICRICLQEGQMRSIYDKDEKELVISDKIMQCSNITIKKGMNLPEQICNKCLDDLNTAFRFRSNCESSDAILQSFMEGNVVTDLIMSSETGEIYKYKPPQGLNVKRIRPFLIKSEPNSEHVDEQCSVVEEHFVQDDDDDDIIEDTIEESEHLDQSPTTSEQQHHIIEEPDIKYSTAMQLKSENDEKCNSGMQYTTVHEVKYGTGMQITIKNHEEATEEKYEVTEQTEDVCTIKTVKTNKARSKGNAVKKPMKIVAAQTIGMTEDGATVIRIRRNYDEPKPLKICEICGNTYKYKHALESHMRRHRNEKPFSCEICGRAFVINFELRRHMRTHTGQKPYACRFCGRRFSDFGSRIKHERTHTGERPYVCDTCGKAFAYSHVLTSHILTHTGEKRFGCAQCGKRFTKSHHLKAHLNTHFKNLNKPLVIPSVIESSPAMNASETTVLYQSNADKVYEDVLTVLTAQPKIEQFVDEDDIEQIHSEEENHHTIHPINIS